MASDNKWLWWLLGGAVVYALYFAGENTSTGEDIVNAINPGAWKSLGSAPLYVPYINSIEASVGLPRDLLARIAYQESHFNPNAVNKSSGALGMFQLMPQYYPQAGQNWQADAQTAAQALAGYYKTYSDWQLAVAAYNDGPGNINSYLAGNHQLPAETTNYVASVFTDVPIAGSLFDIASGQLTA